jgi:molybdopterin converting factor small subunit
MDKSGVTVQFFAAARAAVGSPELLVAAGSLAKILDDVERFHPQFTAIRPRCSFLVDGLAAHGDPAEIMLADGATLDVLPPFAGG